MQQQMPTQGQLNLDNIREEIESGDLVIPDFQRDFVWPVQQSAALLDSWIKGYPLGAFILWVSKDKLTIIKNIGNFKIAQQVNPENPLTYVLDGQQRITSIYAALKGLKFGNKDFSKIVINLDAGVDDEIITILPENPTFEYIPFTEVKDLNLQKLCSKYSSQPNYLEKIQKYHDALVGFYFPTIKVVDVDLNTATEIFTRLNTGGKVLTVFEIMTAKTYTPNFNLKEKIKNILDSYGDYLDEEKCQDIILRSLATCLKGNSKQKTILNLDCNKIFNEFDYVTMAFNHAIDFFRNDLKIPTARLFPYNPMVVPYVYFYYKFCKQSGNWKLVKLKNGQTERLRDYFWRSVFNERYQSGVDTVITEDLKIMDDILTGTNYKDFSPIDTNVQKFIENGQFTMGRAYIKGLICLMIAKEPHSLFDNQRRITFDTNWPIRTSSNNYHHFFPKKSNCIKLNFRDDEVNNICNIILCDTMTNQVVIKNSNPSVYIQQLKKTNPNLNETLQRHFINDLATFGIINDDFNTFCKKRAAAFLTELKTQIIKSKKDNIDTEIS